MKISDIVHSTTSTTQKIGRELHRKAKGLAERVQTVALLHSGYGEIKAGAKNTSSITPVSSFQRKA